MRGVAGVDKSTLPWYKKCGWLQMLTMLYNTNKGFRQLVFTTKQTRCFLYNGKYRCPTTYSCYYLSWNLNLKHDCGVLKCEDVLFRIRFPIRVQNYMLSFWYQSIFIIVECGIFRKTSMPLPLIVKWCAPNYMYLSQTVFARLLLSFFVSSLVYLIISLSHTISTYSFKFYSHIT